MNADDKVTKCDWLFIGDSFTQGAQVDFDDLYTTKLYRHFPNKIVINAGVSGMGLPDEYYLIQDQIKKLKPKKVFLQLCNFNDFMNVEPQSLSFTDYLMEYSDFIRSILYSWKYKSPGELPLGRWTEPFYKDLKDNEDYNVFYKVYTKKKRADLSNFRKYLNMISNEVRNNKAELIIILIPSKEQIYYKYFDEVVTGYNIDVKMLDMNYPDKLFSKTAKELAIPYINLSEAYRASSQQVFFDYDEHLNSWGHDITAEAIAEFINGREKETPPKLLSDNYYSDRYPELSSDGKEIVFQSFRHSSMELFRSDNSLQNQVRLTYNDIDESHPTISPDGKYLAFTQGNQLLNETHVILQDIVTDKVRVITSSNNEYGAIPKFSHNGKYLIFPRWYYDKKSGNMTSPEIVLYDINSATKQLIIKSSVDHWRPIFTPNDSTVVYIAQQDGNYDLFQYNLYTKTRSQLTHTIYDEWDPSVNEDGSFIYYSAQKNDNWDLFKFNLNTLQTEQITNTLGDEWDPFVFKDRLLFAGKFGLMSCIYELSTKAK